MQIAINPAKNRLKRLVFNKSLDESEDISPQYPSYRVFENHWKRIQPNNRSLAELISPFGHFDFSSPKDISRLFETSALSGKEKVLIIAMALVRKEPDSRLSPTHIVQNQGKWFVEHSPAVAAAHRRRTRLRCMVI